MEVTPLPIIFLCLFGVLLCLQLGLVVLILSIFTLSFVLWVGAAFSLDFVVMGSQAQIAMSFV
jgi:hypothetical protein